jgi:hypothetical protein
LERGFEGVSEPPSPVTDADFSRFCEFLYRRTGILFTPAKRYFVDRRLAERMQATGSRSFAIYLARLRADADGEVEHLINTFTINETYFYREDHQLRCLTSSLLPELVAGKTPGSTVRIWSMPCSTGEEPYSVAMWLLENWAEVDRYDVEIVGSDIDTRALAAAEEGRYGERALMRLSTELVARYFERGPARVGALHTLQPHERSDDGDAGSVRRRILPQRPDLLRRRFPASRGGQHLRCPSPGRLCLPRPHREHEPDLPIVQGLPLR